MSRFLRRLWTQAQRHAARRRSGTGRGGVEYRAEGPAPQDPRTIAKVGDDYGKRHGFNTAIAAVMELSNALARVR